MRAVRFHHTGDPDVLSVEEVPEPAAPTGDRILVRVEASSINGTDLGIRRGAAGPVMLGRSPFAPGFDISGVVLGCGPRVTAFAPGDRVAALLGHRGGGQAERVLLRQGRAARVPDAVAVPEAAALPLAGLTALQALYARAGLGGRRSPRVLVNGASGGIGCFAVQLAALAGAHVTGTASGEAAKAAFVAGLGADVVIDHRTHDVTALGERWDVVVDTPGLLPVDRVRRVLTDGGVLVTTRVLSAANLTALLTAPLHRATRATFVATAARSADLAHLLELVRTGRLRVPVDRTFPIAEAATAHRYAESGSVRGKVVLTL